MCVGIILVDVRWADSLYLDFLTQYLHPGGTSSYDAPFLLTVVIACRGLCYVIQSHQLVSRAICQDPVSRSTVCMGRKLSEALVVMTD